MDDTATLIWCVLSIPVGVAVGGLLGIKLVMAYGRWQYRRKYGSK